MADDIAIRVSGVSKDFILPHDKITTVKGLFTGVYKRRRHTNEVQHALHGIDIEIKKGEFFGIVGRNGSGKSTLLKILAGIYQPTKGTVHVDGKLVPFIELGVGFNAELTGRENVYLNGAMLGFSKKQMDDMYNNIVAFAELERFMDQKLKNYSSGMQVRLAFSLATRAQADILLVDEVLAVGDADFQRKCFEYFRTLKRDKKTVVFVSHDMSAVREYCDRAVLIDKSNIVAAGSSDSIASAYSKLFLNAEQTADNAVGAKRWGDAAIVYKRVKAQVTPEIIELTLVAAAKQKVDSPNFGFLIRDANGEALLGTNTHIQRQYIDSLQAHEELKLTWSFDNILNEGIYYIEPAIVYNGTVTADWWEEASRFEVRKEDRSIYPIDPPITLKVTRGS